MIRRSEYNDIVMAHTNSGNITLMARSKEPFTKEEEDNIKDTEKRNWLKGDALLTRQLNDIRNKNCPQDEKEALKIKVISQAVDRYNKFVKEQLGSTLISPFMSLSFMALLVIPALKLSDLGLFDGEKFEFVDLFEK
jgi:hypothetical protein